MSKVTWKPGTLLAPLPVVMATVGTMESANIITIAWTGIVNSDPAMTYISVRKERHSHQILMDNMEFVINLVPTNLAKATDYCGVRSGKLVDKFTECKLTKAPSTMVKAPMIAECPVSIECKVKQVLELGSHDMFLAEIVAVNVEEKLLNDKGALNLSKANLVAYAHGQYYELGKNIGKFGHSVKKPTKKKKYVKKK